MRKSTPSTPAPVPAPDRDRIFEADLVQLQQSYEHYRHLEEIRLKYIVWLYSFMLGLLAFIGAIFGVEGGDLPVNRTGIMVIASFMITFFAFFAHLQVNTTEAAISAHDALMRRIYRSVYKDKYNEFIAQPFAQARLDGKRGSLFLKLLPADSDPTRLLSRMFTATPAFLSAIIGCGILVNSIGFYNFGGVYSGMLYLVALASAVVGITALIDALLTKDSRPRFEVPDEDGPGAGPSA